MTEPFLRLSGVAAPLMRPNIDTDAIIPSREMKRVSKAGLSEGLFAGERYLDAAKRNLDPSFVLNQQAYSGSSILLAGSNFGCGSSREHAVWALKEFGIRALIAPSFGSIFANNCVRNGLLPVTLPVAEVERIAGWVERDPAVNQLEIDLETQQVLADGESFAFDVESGARYMLLNGLDAIALTQTRWEVIHSFHKARQLVRPWLYQNAPGSTKT